MLGKLSYAQKKYALLALALLLGWAGWQLAFKKTVSIYLEYRELAGQAEVPADITYPNRYVGRKQANLNKILEGYRQDSTAFRDNLLYQAAYQAGRQNVKVVQVPAKEVSANNVVLQKIVFQGSYFGLVRLLSGLERTKGVGRVRSVRIRQPGQADKTAQTVMEVYFMCLSKKSRTGNRAYDSLPEV